MKRTTIPHQQPQFVVLTNDPSLTAWGYAVLNTQNNVLTLGCIKTEPQAKKRRIRKGDDLIRRISEIYDVLLPLIARYHVRFILSELPHGSQNAHAAVMIGAVTAICQGISVMSNIAIEWYSEADAKKAVLGRISSTKQQMVDAIAKKYDVQWTKVKYKDEAIADALAIHYAATKSSSVLTFFKND